MRRLADYAAKLEKAKVVLDAERRKQMILADAKNLAFAQGYELVEDAGLLDEVAGLVEWPVVLMGAFDESFLAIPPEVIRATIRNNQKCFVLRDPRTAVLVNRFLLVANTEAVDGGNAIIAGNERVIRARLADAKFFYETDLNTAVRGSAAQVCADRLSREARYPGGTHCAPGGSRRAHRALDRCGCREGRARRATLQGRSAHRGGRGISGTARPDGQILRAGARGGRGNRPCLRGPLQTKRAG